MASNFFEAGLERLLTVHLNLFVFHEIALLNWLYSASKESAAVYWDNLQTVQPGTAFDITISSIKAKCRAANLHEEFEAMYEAFQDRRMAA